MDSLTSFLNFEFSLLTLLLYSFVNSYSPQILYLIFDHLLNSFHYYCMLYYFYFTFLIFRILHKVKLGLISILLYKMLSLFQDYRRHTVMISATIFIDLIFIWYSLILNYSKRTHHPNYPVYNSQHYPYRILDVFIIKL